MTIRHVKHETGDYTFDTETRVWRKVSTDDNDDISLTSLNASSNKDMKERLKEIGLEINTKDPIEVAENLRKKIVGNPDNFYPELSPDYEFIKSTRKSKWG